MPRCHRTPLVLVVLGLGLAGLGAPGGVRAQDVGVYGLDDPSTSTGHPHRRQAYDATLHLGVPLVNGVDRAITRPGFEIAARWASNLGFVAPELELGFRWIWTDLDEAQRQNPDLAFAVDGVRTLRSIFVAPGLRLQIPNASPVTPYLSTQVAFSWWTFEDTNVTCGAYWCVTEGRTWSFTPGFLWRLGLNVALEPGVLVEAGLGAGFSFPGAFFDDELSWLNPYVGLTYRK